MTRIGFSLKHVKWHTVLDSSKIINRVERAAMEVLGKFGTYVRREARASIKRNHGWPSWPNNPPTNRTGLLRNFIFWDRDRAARSVVIGPEKKTNTGAAETLEYGGTSIITFGRNKGKRVLIEPRPYMWPAYKKKEKELPRLWKDCVR